MKPPDVLMEVLLQFMNILDRKKTNFSSFLAVEVVVEALLSTKQYKIATREAKPTWEAPHTCLIK